MTTPQVFQNAQFGSIRTLEMNNEPYFVANDIAQALGYSNPQKAIREHVDDDDKGVNEMVTPGGKQMVTIINESGMYSLVMSSKLEGAKKFKKWVTSDVLPSIRKHGAYMTDNFIETALTDPDLAIRMISEYKEERQKRLTAEAEAKAKQQVIEQQRPKVEFADTFTQCSGSVLVGEMAKMLRQMGVTSVDGKSMGQNTLFDWLRKNHYLGSYGEYYNMPNQQYMAQGLFELKKGVHSENERLVTTTTTKITAKGQMYFINKFRETMQN